jgi:hypothetical protein
LRILIYGFGSADDVSESATLYQAGGGAKISISSWLAVDGSIDKEYLSRSITFGGDNPGDPSIYNSSTVKQTTQDVRVKVGLEFSWGKR